MFIISYIQFNIRKNKINQISLAVQTSSQCLLMRIDAHRMYIMYCSFILYL